MRIIIERPSNDGHLKAYDIEALSFWKKDQILTSPTAKVKQDVILCKLINRKIFTIQNFYTKESRDKALKYLKNQSSSVAILDYNDYFCYETLNDEGAIEYMRKHFTNFNLYKHINIQIERGQITNLLGLPAFLALGPMFINSIIEKREFYIEEVDKFSRLWGKTLWCPSHITNAGISPRQYFKYLIVKNNEKFSNN